MACSFFDIDLEVYMVKVSYQQKPYRRIIMENFGAEVYASPTDRTHAGRAALAQDPNSPGSLGMAISDAVEVAGEYPAIVSACHVPVRPTRRDLHLTGAEWVENGGWVYPGAGNCCSQPHLPALSGGAD
jgi:hypothetical protein